jgi:2-polyprenyl-6-methoxyphenol hydroxylase-like FAD-dependent oxidoreductase
MLTIAKPRSAKNRDRSEAMRRSPKGHPPVEKLLREHAAEYATVKVRLGEEVLTLQQLHDHVSLELEADDGTKSFVTARYVIGCDGASSRIRQCLDTFVVHDRDHLQIRHPS